MAKAKSKKYNHKIVELSYKLECDNQAVFSLVSAILKKLHEPRTPATASHTPLSTYDINIKKSDNAYPWRCVQMADPVRKIQSIKSFRTVTGYSLAAAKNWCESAAVLLLEPHESEALWEQGFVMELK